MVLFPSILGVANYNRYFGPRMPPIFVNSGGKTIKVTVGDTVTIPCKIHNKGKQFYLWMAYLELPGFLHFYVPPICPMYHTGASYR